MDEVSNFCPAMAVPMTVKMPEPMTAPMPRAVSDQGPSVFFSRCSGSSDSEISLSMDLHAKSWFARWRLRECWNGCLRIESEIQAAEQVYELRNLMGPFSTGRFAPVTV
jgi:hypothetical protein